MTIKQLIDAREAMYHVNDKTHFTLFTVRKTIKELINDKINHITSTNKCDTCMYDCIAACPPNPDMVFGEGLGNDNVIACHNYINKEAYAKYMERMEKGNEVYIP